jgi:hypothetical protein
MAKIRKGRVTGVIWEPDERMLREIPEDDD